MTGHPQRDHEDRRPLGGTRRAPWGGFAAVGALAVGATLWGTSLWVVPTWRESPEEGGVRRQAAAVVYMAGALLCHQQADRSFTRGTVPLPVCARCTGLYAGGCLGALAALAVRRRCRVTSARWRAALAVAAVPTAATVVAEWTGWGGASNLARGASAVPLGALAGLMLGVAALTIGRTAEAEQNG